MSTPDEIKNAKLEKIIPEIAASKYGKYPMHGIRWPHVTEDFSPEGEPLYIKGPYQGDRTNYVFGPGTHGELYYHLLTKPSYVILCKRMEKSVPKGILGEVCDFVTSFCISREKLQARHDNVEVCNILYMRARASIPDDEEALNGMLQDARGEAEFYGNM